MDAVDLDDIARMATRLQPLGERFAFVGGCILPLLVDKMFRTGIRPTTDVDLVVEVVSRRASSDLDERLRHRRGDDKASPSNKRIRSPTPPGVLRNFLRLVLFQSVVDEDLRRRRASEGPR